MCACERARDISRTLHRALPISCKHDKHDARQDFMIAKDVRQNARPSARSLFALMWMRRFAMHKYQFIELKMALNVVSIHFTGNLLNKSHENVYSINLCVKLWEHRMLPAVCVRARRMQIVFLLVCRDNVQPKSFHSSGVHIRVSTASCGPALHFSMSVVLVLCLSLSRRLRLEATN